MRFALVNNEKTEALPGLNGICVNPNCQSAMVAKCGRYKVWHWAHKRSPQCDPWWESETKWHRDWKNRFPFEWQEIAARDATTSEVHVADVKTAFGLVIEFQHSAIRPEERIAREEFYGEMVWVVDGNRNELDESYFRLGLSGPLDDHLLIYQIEWIGRSKFMENWQPRKAKVFIDFGEDHLWRLIFFDPVEKFGQVAPLPKNIFVEDSLKGEPFRVCLRDRKAT